SRSPPRRSRPPPGDTPTNAPSAGAAGFWTWQVYWTPLSTIAAVLVAPALLSIFSSRQPPKAWRMVPSASSSLQVEVANLGIRTGNRFARTGPPSLHLKETSMRSTVLWRVAGPLAAVLILAGGLQAQPAGGGRCGQSRQSGFFPGGPGGQRRQNLMTALQQQNGFT